MQELRDFKDIVDRAGELASVRTLGEVQTSDGQHFPLVGVVLGAADKAVPTLGLFGGVHGLERIGTHTVLAMLRHLVERVRWDAHARRRLLRCRVVSMPIINPGGMHLRRRSNPRGVDLMRNAPVDAEHGAPPFFGGHRLSAKLPFYRGVRGQAMQPEARALETFVREELFGASVALGLDVHSGFGVHDRLWFPYARRRGGFPRATEAAELGQLLDRSYPDHAYRVEPQAESYTAHGDLWDYLFDAHYAQAGPGGAVFIPWTLEMGSWRWLRKNPRQILRRDGLFNPGPPHRQRRVQRRHLPLMDFLLSAVDNPSAWVVDFQRRV